MPRWLTLDAPLECTIRAAGTLDPRWAERLGGLRVRAAGERVGRGAAAAPRRARTHAGGAAPRGPGAPRQATESRGSPRS